MERSDDLLSGHDINLKTNQIADFRADGQVDVLKTGTTLANSDQGGVIHRHEGGNGEAAEFRGTSDKKGDGSFMNVHVTTKIE